MTALSSNVRDALELVRQHCPGWSFAVLLKACAPAPAPSEAAADAYAPSLDAAWSWAESRLPVSAQRGEEAREASNPALLKAALRWAMQGDQPVTLHAADGTTCEVSAAPAVRKALAAVVPTASPKSPRVAFVSLSPSEADAAAGRPFSDADGEYLTKNYLAPLGLKMEDVLLTHLHPVAGQQDAAEAVEWVGFAKRELEMYKPAIVVALGSQAKRHLGDAAEFVLPHPAAVRKRGDTGEVTRKLKAVRDRLDHVLAAESASRKGLVVPAEKGATTREVKITKTVDDNQIVMGVVLDGYGFDQQNDWIPPFEIQKTAHDWMENSRVIGLQHAGPADAVVLESWLWPYPSEADYRNAMQGLPHNAYATAFGSDTVHSGSWVIAVKVRDPATWEAVQNGLITGYSIGGTGLQSPATESSMPQVTFVDKAGGFSEDQHPRGPDGKFGGGGSTGGSGK